MSQDTKITVRQGGFELSGGHAALDLVNTLDNRFHAAGGLERLTDYGDLLRFAQQVGLLEAAQARQLAAAAGAEAGARAVRDARELREGLAAVLYGLIEGRTPRPAELRTLEKHFREAARHAELRWQAPAGRTSAGHLAWRRDGFAHEVQLPVWLLAQAAAQLLLSSDAGRVRACYADTCRWLFLDTSKNHSRRWCNMKICGNRMKARRFQARHAH
jgi:predicted RNA-binding Zn ribbon-like protein